MKNEVKIRNILKKYFDFGKNESENNNLFFNLF